MDRGELFGVSRARVHWLRCSFRERLDDLEAWDAENWSHLGVTRNPFDLKIAREHVTGARLFSADNRDYEVLDVPGAVCERVDDRFWLDEVAIPFKGAITRLDLAVDVHVDAPRKEMLKMRHAFRAGDCETKIQELEEHRSYGDGKGFTWYFGGRSSELRLRVYDRRGPLRLEFQWTPCDRDQLLAEAVARDLDACWRMFASKIVFPLEWYRQLLNGDVLHVEPDGRAVEWEGAAQALRDQWGATIHALRLLGVSIESLELPVKNVSRHVRSKFRRWATQAQCPALIKEINDADGRPAANRRRNLPV